jgi:hypothetical protein
MIPDSYWMTSEYRLDEIFQNFQSALKIPKNLNQYGKIDAWVY